MEDFLDFLRCQSPDHPWYDARTCADLEEPRLEAPEGGVHRHHPVRRRPTWHPHSRPSPSPRPHPPLTPTRPSPPRPPEKEEKTPADNEALRAHVAVRNGRPLAWDASLARGAAEAASAIVEAPGPCTVHSVAAWDQDTRQPYGRNTFAIFGADCDWTSVVESWSAESVEASDPSNAAHRLQTQGTAVERVGCAKESSQDGSCHAFVCQYSPRQDAPASGRLRDVMVGPDVACPASCGGVLPCRNTEA